LPEENPRAVGISAKIYHRLQLGRGMAAITRATIRWKMRAYDGTVSPNMAASIFSSFIASHSTSS